MFQLNDLLYLGVPIYQLDKYVSGRNRDHYNQRRDRKIHKRGQKYRHNMQFHYSNQQYRENMTYIERD